MRSPVRDAILIVTLLASGTSACSAFDFGRASRAAEAEEDKAGRIALALGDVALEPDPDMADLSVILPVATTLVEWPQAGVNASKVVGHVRAAETLEVDWRIKAADGSGRNAVLTSPPIASSDTIYLLDGDQTVKAFSVERGARLWSIGLKSGRRRDGRGLGGGLALDGDRLVVSSGFGFVAALDKADGSEIWRRELGVPVTGAPTIKDGRVLVVTENNEVYSLNLQDGSVEWSDQAIAESARVLGAPSVAAVEDLVVAPFSSGEVIAYLGSNGRRLWIDALTRAGRFTPISAINDIASRPVLSSGLVFAASQSGILAAIDGRSGQRAWSQPVGSIQAPALAGQYLFVAGVEGEIACLLAETGAVIWTRQLPKFRRENKRRGRISYVGPVIASDRVLVASSEGDLIALSAQTGEEVGRLRIGDPVFIEPIVAGDRLILLTDEGRLVAIR